MKLLWILPCLAICACAQNSTTEVQPQDAYYGNGYDAYADQQYAQNPYIDPYAPNPYVDPYANPYPQNIYVGSSDQQYQQDPYDPCIIQPDTQISQTQPIQQAPAQQTAASNPYPLKPPAYEDDKNFALNKKEDEVLQKERDLLHAQQELYDREKKLANREAEFINRSKALDYKEKHIQEGKSYAPTYPKRSAYAPVREFVPSSTIQEHAPSAPAREFVSSAPANGFAPSAQKNDVMIEDTLVYSSISTPADMEPAQPGFIIMQHPIQRDLVRCPASDDVCLQSYERLGYVRSANLSRYATQDASNTSGQWRENSSVPRW